MLLSDNEPKLKSIGDWINDLLEDLIVVEGEEGEELLDFDLRMREVRENDSEASTECPAQFELPSSNVPEPCADSVDYTDVAKL